jgi:ATP-binding cassette subfamily B protein
MRRFLPYLWPRERADLKRRIGFSLGLVLVSEAIVLAMPFAYKGAIDRMAGDVDGGVAVALALVIAYGGARFAGTAINNIRNIAFERVGQVATSRLAQDVFHRLHQLSLRFHISRRTGEVTKIIERGTKTIDTMLYFLLFNIAPTAITLVVMAAVFWTMFGWELVAGTAATVAAYIWITRTLTEWRVQLRRDMNQLDGKALHRAVDSLLNYETVKYFGAERREQQRYAEAADAYAEAAIKTDNSLAWLNMAQALVTNALLAGAMAFTVWGWSEGRFTPGDLVLINTYLLQLFRPLDMLGFVYRTIRQGLVDMGEMFALIDTPVEVRDVPGAPALVVRRPTIAFENVTFGYERQRPILKDLSFELPAGSRTAIVGPSGAGKSTIARLLFRFYDPQEGRVLIDQQDIALVQQETVRASIGIVPQDTVLFNDTLGYNISYGREGTDDEGIRAAARDAAILPFIESLPDGFGTQVGERGLKLSGGEKQRIAIARTLVKNPPILLLDEATSALDSRTEQEILATLRRVSANRTTLAIAHRLSTIADADRILVLDEGQLVETGTHHELLRASGLYAEMWARQGSEQDEEEHAAQAAE